MTRGDRRQSHRPRTACQSAQAGDDRKEKVGPPPAWLLCTAHQGVEHCTILGISARFPVFATGRKKKLLGRKCTAGGVFPLTDQVSCNAVCSRCHIDLLRGVSTYIALFCRYSSGLPAVQDTFRSQTTKDQSQLQLFAETMLQQMQIEHWWSHMQTLRCNASTLHGILRAPHGDGKEAMLLATPVSGVCVHCHPTKIILMFCKCIACP